MTNARSRVALVLGLGLAAAACAPDAPPRDVCEQAADHRAACVGAYVTPPICDAAAAETATYLLSLSCDQLAGLAQDGKADGAFCDWFGLGCTADEPIFEGPACAADDACAPGAACREGHCFAGVDSPELTAILDRWTASTQLTGSATHLLRRNEDARALRDQLMAGATHAIHFTAFLFEDDAAGRATIARMAEAARRGVEVRVVIDATTQFTFSSYDVLRPLVEAGGEVLAFNPVTEWATLRWTAGLNINQRLHEKLLVVDGARAVVGGRNVGDDYYADDRWHDTDVVIEGPGVAGVQQMFADIWDEIAAWEVQAGCPQQAAYGFACTTRPLTGDPAYTPAQAPRGAARTRAIHSDPRSQDTPLGYLATLALVRSARASITIANSYFVPPRRLRKHLAAAVARGVKVTVLTNSLGSTDAWWMYYASLNYYEELIGAGVEIHQARGSETMHAKTMLVDGTVAVIGSFNLDPRSAASNSEALVVVQDGDAVGELAADLAAGLADSDVASADISPADWLKAKAFRLAEPLL